MRFCFLPLKAVVILFLPATINGNLVKNQIPLHDDRRELKNKNFLCEVSSSKAYCLKETQLCDTSTGKARCICPEGLMGSRCQDRIYDPPADPATKMPTVSRVGSICIERSNCAAANSNCFEGKCKCESGYTPRKGSCININECEEDFRNECHRDAECYDTDGSYECKCKDGFSDHNPTLAGRHCQQMNECMNSKHNCDEATQICVDRRPPDKWECVERTPAPTQSPTPRPTPRKTAFCGLEEYFIDLYCECRMQSTTSYPCRFQSVTNSFFVVTRTECATMGVCVT